MIKKSIGQIEYYQFEELVFQNVVHGFFSRKGGVSPAPWSSLNVGGSIGDSTVNVSENHNLIYNAIERPLLSKYDVWQVHSTNIICTDKPRAPGEPHVKADAIFTDNPGVTLEMRFADCVPIMLIDLKRKVVGIIHAGWQGTIKRIVCHAIDKIQKRYNVNPKDLVAGIGPSIGPDHYEIGDDLIWKIKREFKENYEELLINTGNTTKFNLWKANEYLLNNAGVKEVFQSDQCTACRTREWFSHRAESGKTGRFAAIIALKSR